MIFKGLQNRNGGECINRSKVTSSQPPCVLHLQEVNLCLRYFLYALLIHACVCVYVFPLGASSIRATSALAVEQEHTKSVWK